MSKTMMRMARGLLLVAGWSILLAACETTGSMNDSSGSNEGAGWKTLEQADIAKLFVGNTTALRKRRLGSVLRR